MVCARVWILGYKDILEVIIGDIKYSWVSFDLPKHIPKYAVSQICSNLNKNGNSTCVILCHKVLNIVPQVKYRINFIEWLVDHSWYLHWYLTALSFSTTSHQAKRGSRHRSEHSGDGWWDRHPVYLNLSNNASQSRFGLQNTSCPNWIPMLPVLA